MERSYRTEKAPACNSTHQQSQAFGEFETSVFLVIFVLSKAFRSPRLALQVCAERYQQPYPTDSATINRQT